MNQTIRLLCLCLVLTGLACSASAMEIAWARMTGQYPVESTPLVADINGDGAQELLAVNRAGQLMFWRLDGAPLGSGQDGAAAQLPEGQWTSTPLWLGPPEGEVLVVGSKEGLLVALDTLLRERWRYALPGETTWGRAVPVVVRKDAEVFCCIGDLSGTVTCLHTDGSLVWSTTLRRAQGFRAAEQGPCKTFLQTFRMPAGDTGLLAPAGTSLYALDLSGGVAWRRDLGGNILSRPEVLVAGDKTMIVCGAGSGSLFALDLDGRILWEAPVGDEIDTSIAFLARPDSEPLILCLGLWGNLHAFDTEGHLVWKHTFRSKTRARPLVLDFNGDGREEVLVNAYNQRVYLFNAEGYLLDEVRLGGILNASAAAVAESGSRGVDAAVMAGTLMAYRLRHSMPAATYGGGERSENVALIPPKHEMGAETPAVSLENPGGAAVVLNVAVRNNDGPPVIRGRVTARSALEVPVPEVSGAGTWHVRATVRDTDGTALVEQEWAVPTVPQTPRHAQGFRAADEPAATEALVAWSTPPYSTFDEARAAACARGREGQANSTVAIRTLYVDEVDQGALIVASTLPEAVRVRVIVDGPKNVSGEAFGGNITLREVVTVGTVNGERVADALRALGDEGLVVIPARGAVKLWVSADAHGAAPGVYRGELTVAPLHRETPLRTPLEIEVVDLRMPEEFPLTLCTWDYIPNSWFPERTAEVLDEMGRHGVNVFPRSAGIPAAAADASGNLAADWSALDAELDRLKGRGEVLFHLALPSITFSSPPSDDEKRQTQIAYVRQFRDHLKERGWEYDRYAFYPVDEPGLDHGKRVPGFVEAAELFRAADPKLRIYTDPVPGLSRQDFERIEPLVDVWCPNMRLVSGLVAKDPRIERIMGSGKPVWSYECVSQVKSLSPLRYNRANAWRAAYFGLDGIGFWTFSTTKVDHWFANDTANDEYALVYPGALPVPSVRWEAVRDGLEDVAAMSQLEARIEARRGGVDKTAVIEEAERALRIARTDIMELSDEAFIESRDFLRAGDRILWHTETDVELYRRHRERIAELTLRLSQ
jgi:hypothetical protein